MERASPLFGTRGIGVKNMNAVRGMLASVTVGCVLLASPAEAAWYTGMINRIQIGADNILVLYIDAPSNHECGSKKISFSDGNAAGFKAVYGALLSWEAQGKSVQFSIVSCSGTVGVFSHVEDLL